MSRKFPLSIVYPYTIIGCSGIFCLVHTFSIHCQQKRGRERMKRERAGKNSWKRRFSHWMFVSIHAQQSYKVLLWKYLLLLVWCHWCSSQPEFAWLRSDYSCTLHYYMAYSTCYAAETLIQTRVRLVDNTILHYYFLFVFVCRVTQAIILYC